MKLVSYEEKLPIPKSLLTVLRDAIIFVDNKGEIWFANHAALELFESSELIGTTINSYLDFELIKDASKKQVYMKLHHIQKHLVNLKCWMIHNENYVILLREISLDEKKERMLDSLHDKVNEPYEGMLLHDEVTIVDCDHALAQMLGYTREELLQQPLSLFIKRSIVGEFKNESDNGLCQIQAIKKNGEPLYIEFFSQPYSEEEKPLQVAIIRDITEGIINKKQIEFMAYYDELTDLPNRNFFSKTLTEAIIECDQNNCKLAIHFVDIDYFKQINDSLGYQFGDEMLRVVAERLKGLLNENNFVARMSGDEFLILQRGIKDQEDAKHFAKRVIAAFEAPIEVNDFEIYTSVSIGISIFPENGTTANDLIKHADSAMYVIKDKQRNHFKLFDTSISDNFREMLTIENELRKAIKENQFEIHYQPQVDIQKDEVIGFEALLRWKHPEKGHISPGVFIPLAEKTGLIIEIGNWVLKEACRQNKEWQLKGYKETKISVNLSVKQFLQKNLVETVKQTLQDTELSPEFLELEITESMAMTNEEYIMETLKGLYDLGVNVSIDDFGTGYSSMKYLSQFPLNKLKIDQLFIRGEQEQNQAIVKSIIHLSHALNMKVIAEGVETKEQLEFLKNECCDEMQGFYFSRPIAPADIDEFFQKIYRTTFL